MIKKSTCFIKSIKKSVNKIFNFRHFRFHKLIPYFYLFLVNCCLMSSAYAETSNDPLASIKDTIAEGFGSGSTLTLCIYIGEVILTTVSYIKTKNLLLLLSIPILIFFTSAMFSYIGA